MNKSRNETEPPPAEGDDFDFENFDPEDLELIGGSAMVTVEDDYEEWEDSPGEEMRREEQLAWLEYLADPDDRPSGSSTWATSSPPSSMTSRKARSRLRGAMNENRCPTSIPVPTATLSYARSSRCFSPSCDREGVRDSLPVRAPS